MIHIGTGRSVKQHDDAWWNFSKVAENSLDNNVKESNKPHSQSRTKLTKNHFISCNNRLKFVYPRNNLSLKYQIYDESRP